MLGISDLAISSGSVARQTPHTGERIWQLHYHHLHHMVSFSGDNDHDDYDDDDRHHTLERGYGIVINLLTGIIITIVLIIFFW